MQGAEQLLWRSRADGVEKRTRATARAHPLDGRMQLLDELVGLLQDVRPLLIERKPPGTVRVCEERSGEDSHGAVRRRLRLNVGQR